ncbi:acyl-CoA dehydrogenase C-terminal domain-containing protein [Altererythrobacter sp. Root672]|uniref:acyl-CoA dehydrogenase C-terminal domain-containing protein n=1 Tax=Altererythrobacter sp. Root672 TaxID=1736584 RepID=UPI0006F24CBA|nr:acyl-CoA dehydrogenase C-terminal domain-containing protein [Altererythrobacter sp. Root672]KRA83289.1 acyl-CoA dehydrogenase [Altererythrobacter sp. Root672]
MSSYTPPIRDVRFVLTNLLDIESYSSLPAFAAVDGDLIDSIIEEAGRFCAEVIAPINEVGDREGCTRHPDGTVTTPQGFPDAYAQYRDAGWGALAMPEEFGGQGLPHVLGTAVEEFLNSSCHAFNMYTGSIIGAVLTLAAKGSDEIKAEWLPKIVSGEWLATMALTEAQAGTDLGLLRTKAERCDDDTFAITGEKIFCSGGEHDLTDNIVHLVLAKLPDAPEGSRGISLFLVPKVMPDGSRNSLSCGAIEHKMGIRASATCVMNFDGAKGWLVGAENEGLAAMFIMMNATRLSCGNQGLGHAEHAYQKAASYALERKQGRAPGSRAIADPLVVHPDVRRMLMDARAFTEGFRALVLWTALQIDLSHGAATETERGEADALVGLLTPVIKAFGTDRGFETAVAMQQIFGGHGYIAEWGIEQIVRDARVAMLYEGANGVQALDLAGRKVVRDGGAVLEQFLAMVESDCGDADEALAFISAPLSEGAREVREAARTMMAMAKADPNNLGAGSYAFLQMMGVTAIGWMWLRLAKAALPDRDEAFCAAKLVTARHYALHALPQVAMLRQKVEAGAEVLMALLAEEFLRG